MKVTLKIYLDGQWKDYPVFNRATADFRLDEQLDTGSVITITDSAEPIPPMSIAELSFSKGENTLSMPAYCFDTVEVRGQGYYVHNLTLVEPTRLLMGILIEGMKVIQPQDGNKKQDLDDILKRLVRKETLLKANFLSDEVFTVNPYFQISFNGLLLNTDSPEFAWEAETQLWECLKDIGSVINCMPRLTFNYNKTALNTIIFDKINDVTEERDL